LRGYVVEKMIRLIPKRKKGEAPSVLDFFRTGGGRNKPGRKTFPSPKKRREAVSRGLHNAIEVPREGKGGGGPSRVGFEGKRRKISLKAV